MKKWILTYLTSPCPFSWNGRILISMPHVNSQRDVDNIRVWEPNPLNYSLPLPISYLAPSSLSSSAIGSRRKGTCPTSTNTTTLPLCPAVLQPGVQPQPQFQYNNTFILRPICITVLRYANTLISVEVNVHQTPGPQNLDLQLLRVLGRSSPSYSYSPHYWCSIIFLLINIYTGCFSTESN